MEILQPMIKIFRHIRKRMLTENKTSKYLLYAIGEIVLVVIGILIALQINNWNEGRKDRIQEQVLLEQLHKEFNSNLVQLDEKIGIRNSIITGSSKLFEYIDDPALRQNDSIVKYTSVIGLAATFDPIANDLIPSGKLQLISNSRLKELLSLWTTEVIQLTEEEVNYYEYRNESYRPFTEKHFISRNAHVRMWKNSTISTFLLDKSQDLNIQSTPSKHEKDLAPILDMLQFENIISNCRLLAMIGNLQSYTLRERMEEVIALIETEMKNKQ